MTSINFKGFCISLNLKANRIHSELFVKSDHDLPFTLCNVLCVVNISLTPLIFYSTNNPGRTIVGTIATAQSCGTRGESAKAVDGELYQSCSCSRIKRQVNIRNYITTLHLYTRHRSDSRKSIFYLSILGQSATRTVGIDSIFRKHELFRKFLRMHFEQAIIHLSKSLNFILIKCLQITSFVSVLEVPTHNLRLQK